MRELAKTKEEVAQAQTYWKNKMELEFSMRLLMAKMEIDKDEKAVRKVEATFAKSKRTATKHLVAKRFRARFTSCATRKFVAPT